MPRKTIASAAAAAVQNAPQARADGSARTFVSTSAVGYYGADTGDEVMTEDRPAGADPLADICREWEAAAAPAREAGVRVCHPRFGIVLDPDGGAFPRMARDDASFNSFFGADSRRAVQTAAALATLSRWRGPGVLVVTTHQANITALTGLAAASGTGVVVRPRGEGIHVVAPLSLE